MDNKRASSVSPKLWNREIGRGAFQRRGSWYVSTGGAFGKANVGISNDKESVKLSHRKTKVS